MSEPMQLSPYGDSDYEHETERGLLFVYKAMSVIGFLFLIPMLLAGMMMLLPQPRTPHPP